MGMAEPNQHLIKLILRPIDSLIW